MSSLATGDVSSVAFFHGASGGAGNCIAHDCNGMRRPSSAFFMEFIMKDDLTCGNLRKQLVRLALPMLVSNVLQTLYSMVDMIVVGQVVGDVGLAAISNATMLCFLINSICIGITMGGTVLVAHYAGAKDTIGLRDTVSTLFVLSGVTAVVLTGVGLVAIDPLFQIMKVPLESLSQATAYMQIMCSGTLFVFGYNAVCAVLRGLGDSRHPLLFVLIATILNVVLDCILVFPFGIEGVGWASVTAQGVSCIIAGVFLYRTEWKNGIHLRGIAFHKSKLRSILRIGLPSAGQMVLVNVSYLLVTGMLNRYGVAVAAAAGIGLKINTLAAMPCWAVGQAVTILVGQNMGAGQIERVAQTARTGLGVNLLVTACMIAGVQLFAEDIINLFNTNPNVVRNGVLYLRICGSANFVLYAIMFTLDSFATGVGDATFAMLNALVHALVMRLLLSVLLGDVLGYGFTGICIGESISPLVSAVLGVVYYRRGNWKMRKII